jgi:hypothetical protein
MFYQAIFHLNNILDVSRNIRSENNLRRKDQGFKKKGYYNKPYFKRRNLFKNKTHLKLEKS